MNSKTLRKVRQYNDAQLYVDTIILIKDSLNVVRNLDKDSKVQFGNDFIISERNMLRAFSLSYRHNSKSEKIDYAAEAVRYCDDVDVTLRIMIDSGIITLKQGANLSLRVGNIITQLNGWVKHIGGLNIVSDGASANDDE